MLSMLLILACTNAGAGGKTSPEVRLRFVAESLTTPGYSEPFSLEARIDETAKTITVFIPELDKNSQPTDDTSISLRVDLPMGYEFELTDAGGAQYTSSDQDTPVSLPMVDLSDSGSFAVTQAGNSVIYTVSTFMGIPIFTEDELRNIEQTGLNKKYFLMNDIALAANFEPLGSSAFQGILDGREKTISNLKIAKSSEGNVGFFKVIGSSSNTSGEVRNLVLALTDGSETSPSIEGGDHVGAIAGRSYGAINNVVVTGGIIKGTTSVGGLVGYQFGTTNSSTDMSSRITDSHVTSAVMGRNHVGGLVGYQFKKSSSITNSYAMGAVTGTDTDEATDTNVGGLVGYQDDGNITASYATGRVEGVKSVGGLVGYQNDGNITASYATGRVKGARFAGGLVGRQDGGSIATSYAMGVVSETDSITLGGLVGQQSGGNITNSYAMSSVKGATNIGGLVGYQDDGNITTSYAMSTVEGNTNVGGLVGYQNGGNITNSYAAGTVEGNFYVAGLLGYQSAGKIQNGYATSTVIGDFIVGGLVGFQDKNTGTIIASYFDANLTKQNEGIGNQSGSDIVIAYYTIDGVVHVENDADKAVTTEASFSDWSFNEDPAENNGDPIWHLPADGGEWPILSWQDPQNQ